MIIDTLKASVIIAAIVAVIFLLFLIYMPNGTFQEIEFEVEEGSGALKISKDLKDIDLIRSKTLFVAYTILRNTDNGLKTGKYLLSPSMSISEVAKILSQGLTIDTDIKITIPEGFNIWEIDERLKNSNLTVGEDFASKAIKYEGYLFPDTYRFKEGTSADEIIKRMRDNFNLKISELNVQPTHNQLVMASIIEKEVRLWKDMGLVSGILWKRIEVEMLLQVDATVAYNYCILESPDGCNTSFVGIRTNLKKEGSYNTYVNSGLPEGPISNPGIQSITAAINPTASEYWFYLNAIKEDGRTIFSKTGIEHEANRAIYILD